MGSVSNRRRFDPPGKSWEAGVRRLSDVDRRQLVRHAGGEGVEIEPGPRDSMATFQPISIARAEQFSNTFHLHLSKLAH
jgi:hypothetical protein